MSKNLHTSFAAIMHLAEGLRFNALLMLKVRKSLILIIIRRRKCDEGRDDHDYEEENSADDKDIKHKLIVVMM
jgi:hypothetical protein